MSCAACAQIAVATDNANIGRRNRSTGSIGAASVNWRCTKTQPTMMLTVNSTSIEAGAWPRPMPSSAVMNRPNVTAFSTALSGSNGWPVSGVFGRKRCASSSASTPAGTCNANSQGHDSTDMIAAATDGPAAADPATISALKPMPRPSALRG